MPDARKYQRAKRNLRKRLRRIVAECEQISRDIGWWNQNRNDAPPFDNGGDICAARLAREMLHLVETDQPIPAPLSNRLREQLEANARRR